MLENDIGGRCIMVQVKTILACYWFDRLGLVKVTKLKSDIPKAKVLSNVEI